MRHLPLTTRLVLTMALALASACVLMLLPATEAHAQQSTTCITPSVTCRAVYAGPKGAPCSCKTEQGWVRGRLG